MRAALSSRDGRGRCSARDRSNRETRIMVTLPSEAASDRDLVRSLATAGMDCARINSAHDDEAAWTAMASNVRAAADAAGRRLPILVDLPGPKLRTGSIEPGPGGRPPAAAPRRARRGPRARPRLARRRGVGKPPTTPGGPARRAGLAGGALGRRRRTLHRRAGQAPPVSGGRRLPRGTVGRDAPGRLPRQRHGADGPSRPARHGSDACRLGGRSIPLAVGDTLLLTRDQRPGRSGDRIVAGTDPVHPPGGLRRGVGGRFASGSTTASSAVVRRVTPGEIEVEITQAPPGGGRLRAEKGINLPDTSLPGSPRSRAVDEPTIAFAVAHADMVGLSFVSAPDDVRAVADALGAVGGDHLGLILKIETRAGFAPSRSSSPRRLREMPRVRRDDRARRSRRRGRLRALAEVQEEILWLCEAAHVPVIWATQVLEASRRHRHRLARRDHRRGHASRARSA